ncbi:A/G-specific adenine glycosylase [Massilibacteroides sp.]|uniref:A/G-specific adenine glycosylase n=1 Tax=Massilibacteroides sp. TaxID=2034766 RepID=UPI002617859A|nr:A/G-specific adenine glycosylase [Massilibacteroides sp.]MDD4514963.1 A/G-specific adenine glycosylase [Massilibacteroides sp.]
MISVKLRDWYQKNKRDLPWRKTDDPYIIWISEIMLQQTRVAQGYDYFLRFTERFPDVRSLAEAPEDEVMKHWEGLGYYSRARNLHVTAKRIVEEFGGIFPSDYETVLSLKGIGEYTAAAIVSISWNKPYAVVDGNVYRVLSRLFGVETPIDTGKGKKEFAELAAHIMDVKHAGEHNQALMEFGALYCIPRNPDCESCIFADRCLAYAKGNVSQLPVKQGKTKVRHRYFYYFHILSGRDTFLNRRGKGDIWEGLYEFPLIETDRKMDFVEIEQTAAFRQLFSGSLHLEINSTLTDVKHVLSHQILHAVFFQIRLDCIGEGMEDYLRIPSGNLDDYAFPRLLHIYLEKIKGNLAK